MLLGRVVGTVWATRKVESLEGVKLLLVCPTLPDGKPTGAPEIIAVDSVGAGAGEIVLVAQGSSARQTAATKDRPCDAVIMAIVDSLEQQADEDVARDYERRSRRIQQRIRNLPES